MVKIPVAIKCRREFVDEVIKLFPKVEVSQDGITGFFNGLNGIPVIIDDSLDKDKNCDIEYREVPSAEDITEALKSLRNEKYLS